MKSLAHRALGSLVALLGVFGSVSLHASSGGRGGEPLASDSEFLRSVPDRTDRRNSRALAFFL